MIGWFRKKIVFWVLEGGDAEFSIRDDMDRLLYTETLDAYKGLNTYEWDYMVDLDLALKAEAERMKEKAEDEEAEEEVKEKKEKIEEQGEEEPKKGAYEKKKEDGLLPYVTPGKYKLEIETKAGSHELDLEVEARKR